MTPKEKLIIFCGTFDPIHNGHLLAAKAALNMIDDGKLIFVPTKEGLWKKALATTKDRLEMLKLIAKDEPRFSIDTYELESLDISYTLYTVQHFKICYPKAKLYLLIGSDQVNNFHKWFMAEKLSKMAKILYIEREGIEVDKTNVVEYNMKKAPLQNINKISSTEFKKTKNLNLLPEAVGDYIKKKHIYEY